MVTQQREREGERERAREVSGEYKKHHRHTHNGEKRSVTQSLLVSKMQMIKIKNVHFLVD